MEKVVQREKYGGKNGGKRARDNAEERKKKHTQTHSQITVTTDSCTNYSVGV